MVGAFDYTDDDEGNVEIESEAAAGLEGVASEADRVARRSLLSELERKLLNKIQGGSSSEDVIDDVNRLETEYATVGLPESVRKIRLFAKGMAILEGAGITNTQKRVQNRKKGIERYIKDNQKLTLRAQDELHGSKGLYAKLEDLEKELDAAGNYFRESKKEITTLTGENEALTSQYVALANRALSVDELKKKDEVRTQGRANSRQISWLEYVRGQASIQIHSVKTQIEGVNGEIEQYKANLEKWREDTLSAQTYLDVYLGKLTFSGLVKQFTINEQKTVDQLAGYIEMAEQVNDINRRGTEIMSRTGGKLDNVGQERPALNSPDPQQLLDQSYQRRIAREQETEAILRETIAKPF